MIQTEPTPNPESLKFISDNIISAIGTEEFQKNAIDKIDNLFIKELLNFKGVELVLSLLHERVETYKENIYIISHRKESAKAATGEVINLQKQNGITTRVDFVDEN